MTGLSRISHEFLSYKSLMYLILPASDTRISLKGRSEYGIVTYRYKFCFHLFTYYLCIFYRFVLLWIMCVLVYLDYVHLCASLWRSQKQWIRLGWSYRWLWAAWHGAHLRPSERATAEPSLRSLLRLTLLLNAFIFTTDSCYSHLRNHKTHPSSMMESVRTCPISMQQWMREMSTFFYVYYSLFVND